MPAPALATAPEVHRACGAQIQLLNDERARALVTDIHKLKVMRSLEECTRWEQRLHELGDAPSSEDEEEEEDRRASKVCGAASCHRVPAALACAHT